MSSAETLRVYWQGVKYFTLRKTWKHEIPMLRTLQMAACASRWVGRYDVARERTFSMYYLREITPYLGALHTVLILRGALSTQCSPLEFN